MADKMLAEIENDTYTAADERRVRACLETFRYTTTFLAVLQIVLRRDDPKAADLVGTIENRMAKHEAATA